MGQAGVGSLGTRVMGHEEEMHKDEDSAERNFGGKRARDHRMGIQLEIGERKGRRD